MRRCVPVVLLALGLVLGFALAQAPAASAHDVVESTNPADGTTVDRLPATVSITLSDDPLAIGSQVLVKGPAGDVAQGRPRIEGRVLTQALSAQAPAGNYVVTYRVTSSDGHPISGTFSFHATVGLDGSTATEAAPAPVAGRDTPEQAAAKSSQFVPVMLTIAGIAIVMVLVAGVWLVARRRSQAAARP
ncbi:MAG: copper resistance protein CopC [Intrasporangium sp.]|uniref:copper resistance CopC family protein n=1 Tax=Intrasporangium sp. TaxID=1925024 RepID=UPI002648F8DF|nr:copper resistance CopC family protein [Intrasporangium sp.]MDN5795433.1 copper resistance protein CopC [Intrasporangium sp.]